MAKWKLPVLEKDFFSLKYASQNQSFKAHYKAGNIFTGFFLVTQGQRLPGATVVWTEEPQIPSQMPRPLGHIGFFLVISF